MTPDHHTAYVPWRRLLHGTYTTGPDTDGGKLPHDQVWQLVAYVRSLSGLVRRNAASGRSDHMHVKKPDMATDQEQPTSTRAEPPQ